MFRTTEKIAKHDLLSIDPIHLDEFIQYVTIKEQSGPTFLECCTPEKIALIQLLREELTVLLPLTLKRNANAQYGFSKSTNQEIAIPYETSQPVEGSEFGNPYETLHYSIQLLFYTRLSPEKIQKWISHLKNDHEYELSKLVKSTEANQFFKTQLCKTLNKDLLDVTNDDLPAIISEINERDDCLWKYFERYILPEVGYYDQSTSANGFSLVDMFPSIIGFTGTLWNKGSMHYRVSPVENREMNQSIEQLLCSTTKNIQVVSIPMPQTMEQLFSNLQDTFAIYDALIDCGAWFKGISNEIVAKFIHTTRTIIFFGTIDNQLYIWEKNSTEPHLFEGDVAEKGCFVFYDHAHSIGAHIRQHPFAKAIVTITCETYIKDFSQAVYRMRDIEQGQHIDVLAPKEFLTKYHVSTIQELIKFFKETQSKKIKVDNFLSYKDQLHNGIKRFYLDILYTTAPIDKKLLVWKEAAPFFLKEQAQNALTQYTYSTSTTSSEATELYLKELKRKCSTITSYPNSISHHLDKIPQPDPTTLPDTIFIEPQKLFDTHQEVQKERLTLTNTSIEISTEELNPAKWLEITWINLTQNNSKKSLIYDSSLQKFINKYLDATHTSLFDPNLLHWAPNNKKIFNPLQNKEPELAFFDSNIFYTINFSKTSHVQQSSFAISQPLAQYLYIQKEADAFFIICLTTYDVFLINQFFCTLSAPLSKPIQACVYNTITNTIVHQSSHQQHQFTPEALAADKKLQCSIAQVKLFNGNCDYTPIQFQELSNWLYTKPHKTMLEIKNTFENKILYRFPELLSEYKNSKLQKFFIDLQASHIPLHEEIPLSIKDAWERFNAVYEEYTIEQVQKDLNKVLNQDFLPPLSSQFDESMYENTGLHIDETTLQEWLRD